MKTVFAIVLAVVIAVPASAKLFDKKSDDEKREKIEAEHAEIIKKIIDKKPEVKQLIERSPGYATFNALNVNVLLASTVRGKGYLVDNKTKKETYMKVMSIGGGVGAGIKDLQALFIFNDYETLKQFRDKGWQFGAQADASLKSDEKGAAVGEGASVGTKGDTAVTSGTSEVTGARPKIDIYRITKAGISLQATIAGTKFSKMDKLNDEE